MLVEGPATTVAAAAAAAAQANIEIPVMLARAAKAQGVKNFVHVSALAADLDSPSRWARTKV